MNNCIVTSECSRFDKLGIPSYFSPEDAARGMATLVKYGMYLKKYGLLDHYLKSFNRQNATYKISNEQDTKKELGLLF